LFSFIFILSLFSCKKLLEIKETDAIVGDVALQTVENTEQGIIGAYALMNVEMSILLNATLSDEVKVGEFYNAGTTHEWQYTSTDIGIRDNFTATTPFYRLIDRANRVLLALPKAQPLRGPSDEAIRTRVRGEALFLRAFAHFELYRYYSGSSDPNALAMAYLETPTLTGQARIPVGPYFQKLKADMTEAKNLLPASLPTAETAGSRATKMAVTGLQSRVHLYLREWADAITFSTEYINALPLATRAQFPGIWTDANTTEVAFRLIRAPNVRVGGLFRGTSTRNTAGDTLLGTVTWVPSDKLWNSYSQTTDIRFSSYLRNEPLLTRDNNRNSRIIHKYRGGGYTSPTENSNHIKVFRTGEMILNRAEARAENNDLTGAAADLNTLRAARIEGYVNEVFTSKDALITAIINERFKELAFEGHRFWDLRRKNLPVERLASDAPNAASRVLPAGNFRFRLPIPNAEIQANPLIVQNEGYTN